MADIAAQIAIDKIQHQLDSADEENVKLTESRARNRVLLKVIEECMWDEIEHECYTNINRSVRAKEYFDKWNDIKKKKEAKLSAHGRGAKYMYVTINPAVDDLQSLRDYMDDLQECDWFTNYYYSYEQRSIDTDAYGWHVHILFKLQKDHPPSHYKKLLISKLKHSNVEIKINKKNPYIRYIKDIENYYRVLEYIRGEKIDPEKQNKVKSDRWHRSKLKLEPFYSDLQLAEI